MAGSLDGRGAWALGGRGFLIKIPIGKSCFILLTPEEYRRGIERGKAVRRRKQFQEREDRRRGTVTSGSPIQQAGREI